MSGSEPRVLYAKCEALYVPKYAQGTFLLFSFEDAGMYPKYSAEKIFIGEAESAKS